MCPAVVTTPTLQELWQDLYWYPENWLDNRPVPADKKYPDFKHKESDAPLWLDAPGRRACMQRLRQRTPQMRLRTRHKPHVSLTLVAPVLRARRPSCPDWVHQNMGLRGQDPPPRWTPPANGAFADGSPRGPDDSPF